MGKFTQEQETQIVKDAMNLTATIEYEQDELNKFKAQRFRQLPQAPVRQVLAPLQPVKVEYPQKPKAKLSYTDYIKEDLGKMNKGLIVLGVLSGFGMGLYIIYSFISYPKKIQEINEELAKEPEYLQAVEKAEKIAAEKQKQAEENARIKQAKLDEQYKENKMKYENEIVPKYNEELDLWSKIQKRKIAIIEEEIKLNQETLANLYDQSKIISSSYRQLAFLCWLYEDMSTSDHDIRYATELLDRDRQRIATQEAGVKAQASISHMEQTMKQGFNAVYNAIEDGNDLQAETIDILSKTRRDMKTGNFIGTVQRHNTNKMLQDMLPPKR